MHKLGYREQRGEERRELYMREACLSPASGQLVSALSIHSVPNGLGGPVLAHNWPGPHVTGPAAERPIPTGLTQAETMDDWANHGS